MRESAAVNEINPAIGEYVCAVNTKLPGSNITGMTENDVCFHGISGLHVNRTASMIKWPVRPAKRKFNN